MGFLGTLLGAAGNLLGGAPKPEPPADGLSVPTTANVLGNNTPTEQPNVLGSDIPKKQTEEEPGPIDQWMGTNPGKFTTGIASGLIDDARMRRNTRNKVKDLKGQGLTIHEIAGGGGGGAAVPAQGSTMGSGPTNIKERALDRKQTKYGADIQARDRVTKMGYEGPLAETRRTEVSANINLIQAHSRRADFDLANIWAMKYATMSADNMMVAIASAYAGVTAEDVLISRGEASPQALEDMLHLYDNIASLKARGATEVRGLLSMGRNFIEGDNFLSSNNNLTGASDRDYMRKDYEKMKQKNLRKKATDFIFKGGVPGIIYRNRKKK